MESQDSSASSNVTQHSRSADEAQALGALVNALNPLDQSARIRLLRTIGIFFEIDLARIANGGVPSSASALNTLLENDRNNHSSSSFSEDRSISPKAFLIEKRPQSDVERIACLAYYLTHYRDQANFKTLDLSKLNTEAAQIKLSNPTRAVDNAAASHFLIPAGQGRKQLSAIGELYVQALPDRTAAREAIADFKRKRAKSRSKGSAVDESVTIENNESLDFDNNSIETP